MSIIERMTGWVFFLSGVIIFLIAIYMFYTQGIIAGEIIGRTGHTTATRIDPYGCFGIALILFILATFFLRRRSPKIKK